MPPSAPLIPAAAAPMSAWRVTLLVARGERRSWLHALVTAIAPGCRIDHASSPIDAAMQLARAPADLLVLDLALDDGATRQLIHHLARAAPSTVVLAFDESAAEHPTGPGDVWSWQEAHTALRRALDELNQNPRTFREVIKP